MKIISRVVVSLAIIITFSLLLVNTVSMADSKPKTLLAFGDSLMQAYGVPPEKSFPAQLEKKLQKNGYNIKVIDASVEANTTSGGLTRLDWTLNEHHPDFVIVELGNNDMLRAVDPDVTKKNLSEILKILKERKIPTMLAGTKATPNLGKEYAAIYQKIYKDLAKEHKVILYPFFLNGLKPEDLLLGKNMHPTEDGVQIIVDSIFPSVKKLVTKK